MGLVVAGLLVAALVTGGAVWAAIALTGDSDANDRFSDQDYAAFAGNYAVDVASYSPGDRSGIDRAAAAVCPGSEAEKRYSEGLDQILKMMEQTGATVRGTVTRSAVDSAKRTPDAVPVLVVLDTESTTTASTGPQRMTTTMSVTVGHDGSDLCVANIEALSTN